MPYKDPEKWREWKRSRYKEKREQILAYERERKKRKRADPSYRIHERDRDNANRRTQWKNDPEYRKRRIQEIKIRSKTKTGRASGVRRSKRYQDRHRESVNRKRRLRYALRRIEINLARSQKYKNSPELQKKARDRTRQWNLQKRALELELLQFGLTIVAGQ